MKASGEPLPGWEGRDASEWTAWLGVPALELHPAISSTNDRARELAREGASPWTVVVAGSQSRGRGRGGKGWVSPSGAGLWMSVLVPRGAGEDREGEAGALPLVLGVAGALALEEVSGREDLRVLLKWPNDLLLSHGKVGGILCEASGPGGPALVVAGIGINLRRPSGLLPPELDGKAAFVGDLGLEPSPPELAREVIRQARRLLEGGPGGLRGEAAEEWRLRDHLAGRRVSCQAGPEGTAAGVGPEGALLVVTDEGEMVPVRAGGVRTRDASEPVTSPPGDGEA